MTVAAVALAAANDQAPPRTWWNAPDLQGSWNFSAQAPLQRAAALQDKEFITAEAAAAFERDATERRGVGARQDAPWLAETRCEGGFPDAIAPRDGAWRTSQIVDPPDGRLPALTPAASRFEAQRRDGGRGQPEAPVGARLAQPCATDAGPPIRSSPCNHILRLFQTPGYVLLFTPMIGDYRIVWFDDRPPAMARARQAKGESRGRWEGDSLVVETRNFSLDNVFSASGLASGANGIVTERFTRLHNRALLYEYTLDDPETFVAPFSVRIELPAADDRSHPANAAQPCAGAGGLDRATG